MKRCIKSSWYVGETSAAKYGKALSDSNKKRNDRYYPFTVSNCSMDQFSTATTGHKIKLGDYEWYTTIENYRSFSSDKKETLHGPYFSRPKYSALLNDKTSEDLGKFDNLDQIVSYLYTKYDTDVESSEGQ